MSAPVSPAIAALTLPNGARFYRSALQVNPYAYLLRHKKTTTYTDEASYNQAIVKACLENQIEIIAVTDHFRASTSESLRAAAIAAGIHAFPGFEAVTKDGVHFLCLFPPDRDANALERAIGDCGVHGDTADSPTGQHDAIELLDKAAAWGAVCIAAHVASEGGLLKHLKGTPRINAWRSQHLFACSLPGPVADAPEGIRPILQNKDQNHSRPQSIAVLNAQDACDPADLQKPEVSCWIKMSEVSVEGLRQAFLEPDSRIRLASDPQPDEHTELLAVSWQGGFLDGAAIHFNENLNVLIGGRGTGKSTIVESIRYALDLPPLGEDARKIHDGIIRKVLKDGTKISLAVRSHHPAKCVYLIERTIPNPPTLKDDTGTIVSLQPRDIAPSAEVYGQHEISELTKSGDKLTHLLDRFVDADPALVRKKADTKRGLDDSHSKLLKFKNDLQQIDERLAALPGLEETLKRYEQAGLEDKLKERSLLVKEEQILKLAPQKITELRESVQGLQKLLPINRTFVSAEAITNLANNDLLGKVDQFLNSLSNSLAASATQQLSTIATADDAFKAIQQQWAERKKKTDAAYEQILRELQKSKIDGHEYIRLRQQIEELRPLRDRRIALQQEQKQLQATRREQVVAWEDQKGEEFRKIETAAKRVSKKLASKVQVQIRFAGNREPFFDLLRNDIGGRLSEAVETLKKIDSLSLTEFVDECRKGADALSRKYGLSKNQAERVTQASEDFFMKVEELDLPPTTTIALNVASESQAPVWQTLDALSTGQKATAVLLLLLLESEAPLIVDQPEDDLDNRFITDGIVPKMKDEKRRRQFIFSTHNANIPVLGDAELILGLSAVGDASQGRATIDRDHMGSIDNQRVREQVEEVLEGGKEAFEMRRLKYGF